MPYADPEKRKTYQENYRKKNKDRLYAQTLRIKKENYGGTCEICGAQTVGYRRDGKHIRPRFCANHRKELWQDKKKKENFVSKAKPRNTAHPERPRMSNLKPSRQGPRTWQKE